MSNEDAPNDAKKLSKISERIKKYPREYMSPKSGETKVTPIGSGKLVITGNEEQEKFRRTKAKLKVEKVTQSIKSDYIILVPELVVNPPIFMDQMQYDTVSSELPIFKKLLSDPLIPHLNLRGPLYNTNIDVLDANFTLKPSSSQLLIPNLILQKKQIPMENSIYLREVDKSIIELSISTMETRTTKSVKMHIKQSYNSMNDIPDRTLNKITGEPVISIEKAKPQEHSYSEPVYIDIEETGIVDELFSSESFMTDNYGGNETFLGNLLINDRPILVLAYRPTTDNSESTYDYDELLIRLLREVFRMSPLGLPRPFVIGSSESLEERTYEFYATNTVGIVSIKGEIRNIQGLKEKIRELFSQGYGFLVFYDSNPLRILSKTLSVRRYLDLPANKESSKITGVPAPIVKIYLKENFLRSEKVLSYVNMIWGRILKSEKLWPPYNKLLNQDGFFIGSEKESYMGHEIPSINEYARHAETMYYKALSRIATSTMVQLEVTANKDEESLTHYAIKSIAQIYLKHVLKRKNVRSEYPIDATDIVDVYSDGIIIEVETLYGRGLPLLRLRNLVEERRHLLVNNELWIVLPPPQTALLPKNWLRIFVKWVNEKMGGETEKIKLFTVDIDEAIKLIRNVEKGELNSMASPLVRIR